MYNAQTPATGTTTPCGVYSGPTTEGGMHQHHTQHLPACHCCKPVCTHGHFGTGSRNAFLHRPPALPRDWQGFHTGLDQSHWHSISNLLTPNLWPPAMIPEKKKEEHTQMFLRVREYARLILRYYRSEKQKSKKTDWKHRNNSEYLILPQLNGKLPVLFIFHSKSTIQKLDFQRIFQ